MGAAQTLPAAKTFQKLPDRPPDNVAKMLHYNVNRPSMLYRCSIKLINFIFSCNLLKTIIINRKLFPGGLTGGKSRGKMTL